MITEWNCTDCGRIVSQMPPDCQPATRERLGVPLIQSAQP